VPDHTARNAGDGDGDQVTEAVLAFGDDEESGEQVLDEALSTEAECHTDDSGRRHEPRDRHAQAIQDLQCRDDVDDHQSRPGEHLSQGRSMLGGLRTHDGVGLAGVRVDAIGDHCPQPRGEPGQQDGAEDEKRGSPGRCHGSTGAHPEAAPPWG